MTQVGFAPRPHFAGQLRAARAKLGAATAKLGATTAKLGATTAKLAALGLCVCCWACKDTPKPPDPHSLAALEAEGPPHTPDCRSWDALDEQTLPALPDAPHMAAFEQVWRTVGHKHYDPTLACLDWPALREQYAKQIVAAGDDTTAAYAAINELLGLLGQSHLHATAPTPSRTRARDSGPATVPITIRWLALEPGPSPSKFAAVVVDEAVDDHASGLPRGAILTEVAGESVDSLAQEVASGVEARAGRPAETAFLIAQAIGAMLSCPEGGTKRVGFLDPSDGDAKRELEVACFLPEGERISLGNLRNLPTTVESRMIPDAPEPGAVKVGYLAFNFWMLPMTERLRSGVDELRAQGMAALIIDLRGNPGGVGAMSIPIARMFLREATSLGVLQMREFNQEFNVEPNPEAFDGPIVILVDEGTASTSEIFALGMRDVGRVTIAGAGPSAGMALPSMIETLPDGGMIQYVVGDYHSGKGTVAEGEGVVPELVVPESRADYVAGRDPVLDAAVEQLRTRPPDSPTTTD
ncbi:S41 family peptidase [Enhygromyxa salina]|uniref:Tail-specific protease n=1 Tax=Enhygromyxa salina TaxID=215803 RepID=A0A2S9YLG0_9BACT|nr:S41 family peptidase [Enhygromyxa salina]PRQ05933.1 Tail-specific protease precursor [Enhygromyxa salina]